MRIHNSAGQLVKEAMLDQIGTISVSVENLQNGIYFLSIQTETTTETHRFVMLR